MGTRRKYDKQFKIESVNHLNKSDKTATEVASDLGLRPDLLSRWKRELEDENKEAFTGNGNSRDEELLRLKKELAEMQEERDILKKALAIFSKPGK